LQFAYYESALAVDFLVQRFGRNALKEVLDDLGGGSPINETLPRRTKMSLEQLDGEFARFARGRAQRVAPEATWAEPDLPGDVNSATIATWLESHPKSFHGWRRLAGRLVTEQKWARAKHAIGKLRGLYPEYVGPENAYTMLATVHRRLSDPAA